MVKQISITIIFILTSLLCHCQSYIGFGGGINQPLAYEKVEKHSSTDNFKEDVGFYFNAFIKERLNRRFNFGFSFAVSSLDISYRNTRSEKVSTTISMVELESYRLFPQLDLELAVIKKYVFFNFGPKMDIPLYTYSSEEAIYWGITNGKISSQGKYKTNWAIGLFLGLTLEKNVSDNKILFIKSQISQSLSGSYKEFETSDLLISGGIQFYFPNLIIGQKKC